MSASVCLWYVCVFVCVSVGATNSNHDSNMLIHRYINLNVGHFFANDCVCVCVSVLPCQWPSCKQL